MIQTNTFTSTNGAQIILDSSNVDGARFIDGNRNAQITCENLNGGTYNFSYRVPGGSNFISHIVGAGEADLVLLAGKSSPVFEAIKLTFSNVGNTEIKIVLSTWTRGI